MGDTPLQPGSPAEFPRQDASTGVFHASLAVLPGQAPINHSPAFSPSHLRQQHGSPQHAFSSQLDMAQPHGPPRAGPFDLSTMANSLPQQAYRPGPYSQGQARYNTIAMSSPVSQFGSQNTMAPVPSQQYYMPQPTHMAHFYATPLSPQAQANVPSRPDMGGYYPNVLLINQQQHLATQYYYPQAAHFTGQATQAPAQPMVGQYAAPSQHHVDPRISQQLLQQGSQIASATLSVELGKGAAESRHNVVRGPPRKPRQSGHAIWIGNLPPQTDLMSLVHHVCKEADGLESLFLISKSNCAFANFKDEPASVAAQRKLHDSKFLTVRLVSRLRKSTVEGPAGITAPTGPASSAPHPDMPPPQGLIGSRETQTSGGDADASTEASTRALGAEETIASASLANGEPPQKDRFFILKSLTVEDIELSVRTGIWATQSQNEESLNGAFQVLSPWKENADDVYLVFSANKSGEYFGYARMTSPINNDPEAAIEFAPKLQSTADVELPKAIPTEATEFAPKGRIIDDSARGTIFWEAERDDQAAGGGGPDDDGSGGGSISGDTGSVKSGQESAGGESKAWGKPFRVEWLSTARLPFYRTRGMRNPWNSNREVKIARDGTELEPSVGRRLIGLFDRVQSPALAGAPGLVVGGLPGGVPGAVPGVVLGGGPGGIRGPMQATTGYPPVRQGY
ncbi:YT521-B-like domain-containing protein [Lasiosphaeris hirsuta]|uniref:YT521-B-like domain-containing protein n=1 Tax=Lasiosphaeris hirsuta TaxID=260670 RepID=A0AA40BAI9_9PEZI|nr:YT521-B-like domain-containing protein [Lasiosphaeris hirsuta]